MTKYSRENTVHTKLAEWMHCASATQVQALAFRCNTSVGYLRQLAHAHRENPRVRFALKIVEAANEIREETALIEYSDVPIGSIPKGVITYHLPKLDIYDIAEPTKRPAICNDK